MDKKEWEMLLDANAKLNSPEVRKTLEEIRNLQTRYAEHDQSTEPFEAILHVPYTETEKFIGQIQDVLQAESQIQVQIKELSEKIDDARISRIENERKAAEELLQQKNIDRHRFVFTAVVGILSLDRKSVV